MGNAYGQNQKPETYYHDVENMEKTKLLQRITKKVLAHCKITDFFS